ncbi:hypothetical protein ACFYY3_20040 [Streptomyces sp. NPDC001812]|uniref:hypothetical protein n=1 Tax=Streptomyces sp. NPDC001812 TaxID=3364611 RepID=UPI0036998AF6
MPCPVGRSGRSFEQGQTRYGGALARQVSEARTAAERRLYEAVARATDRADPALAPALAELLVVAEGKRGPERERLRTPPTKTTGTAMVRAMERVEEISAFALGRVDPSRVPVNRLSTPARYGQLRKAQTIERAQQPRRTALLTAVVRQLEAQVVDDALDLFAVLMANRLISPVRRASDRERLEMLPQLEKAARILAKASKSLTEELDLAAEHDADLDVAERSHRRSAVPKGGLFGARGAGAVTADRMWMADLPGQPLVERVRQEAWHVREGRPTGARRPGPP